MNDRSDRENLGAFYQKRFDFFRRELADFDSASVELYLSLLRTGDMLRASNDRRLRKHGLSGPSYGILTLLESAPQKELPMCQIGEQLVVTQANVTGLVDTLEKKGFVKRKEHPTDRRICCIHITPAGSKKLREIFPIHMKTIQSLFQGFQKKDQAQFIECLHRVRKALLKISALFLIFCNSQKIHAAAVIPVDTSSHTLAECYRLAQNQSETLRIQNEKLVQAESKIDQARGSILPHLTLSGSEFLQDTSGVDSSGGGINNTLTRQERPEAKVVLRQPLFSGFKEFAAMEGSKSLLEKSRLDLKQASKSLFLDVAKLFYNIVRLETQIHENDATIELTKERLTELGQRVYLGKSRKSEVLTTESQLASLMAQKEKTEGDLLITRETLSFITGLPSTAILIDDMQEPSIIDPMNGFVERINKRSDIQSLQESVSIAQSNLKVVKANLYPSANFLGNYYLKRVGFQEKIDWDLLFSLDIPIFQGGQASAQAREALSQLRESEWQLKRAQRSAETEIKSSYYDFRSSIDQLKTLQTAVTKAEESYQIQVKEYRLGLVNNLDVLQALNQLQSARQNLDVGKLQAKLNLLQLKVTTEELP